MIKKTWKKALAGLCAAAMVVTGISWPVMDVSAEQVSENKIWLELGETYTKTIEGEEISVSSTNADVVTVESAFIDGDSVLYDHTSNTNTVTGAFSAVPNNNISLEDAEFTITASGEYWQIQSDKNGQYLTNTGANSFFNDSVIDMNVVTSRVDSNAFELCQYEGNRYVIFYYNQMNFNANKSYTENYTAGSHELYLLEKQESISETDTLPGYKIVTTITSGNEYLITHIDSNGNIFVLYPENGTGNQSKLYKPATGVDANVVKVTAVATGTTTVTMGNESYEVVVNDPANENYDYDVEKLTVAAGSIEADGGANEGSVYNAFDNNENTIWHTEWNPGQANVDLWIVMAFEEATVVDGIRWQSRGANGDVTGYEIFGTTDTVDINVDDGQDKNNTVTNADSITWTSLGTGTWSTGAGWNFAAFDAQELTAVKVVVLTSFGDANRANYFASAKEIRVRTTTERDADYTAVDTAIAAANEIDSFLYTPESWNALQTAISAVVRDKKISEQETVDGYAEAINAAIDGLDALINVAHQNSGALSTYQGSGTVIVDGEMQITTTRGGSWANLNDGTTNNAGNYVDFKNATMKNAAGESYTGSYVQLDLKALYDVYKLNLYAYNGRTHYDVVMVLAEQEEDFSDSTKRKVVYSSDENDVHGLGVAATVGEDPAVSNYSGIPVVLDEAVQARYVRIYMNGNTNTYNGTYENHIQDLQVYATPIYRVVTADYVSGCDSSMGTMSVTENVESGTNATFTATANHGYNFVGWYATADASGETVSTEASYTTRVDDDTTLYAKYEKIVINKTMVVGEKVTISGNIDTLPETSGIIDTELVTPVPPYEATGTIESGKQYLVVHSTGKYVTTTVGGDPEGLQLATGDYNSDDLSAYLWTVESSTDGYYTLKNGNNYLSFVSGGDNVNLSETPQNIKIVNKTDENAFAIYYEDGSTARYLNNFGGYGYAASYTGNDQNWFFYEPSVNTEITATAVGNATIEIDGIIYNITVNEAPVKLSALSVTLDGSIGVNYKMTATETLADDAYMQFKVGDNTSVVKVSEAEVDSKGRYVFTCEVCAPEMTKTIVAQMFNADGTVISAETEYSVKYYADQMIAKLGTDEANVELVTLLKAMLNYGAYAQTEFDVNTDNLANASLSSADRTLSTITADTIKVDAYNKEAVKDIVDSASLILNSKTDFRQYLATATADGYTFELSDKTLELTTGSADGKGYVQVNNIPAAELDNEYELTVSNGTVSGTVYFSPLNYVQAVLNDSASETSLINVVTALYWYNVAANNYFD